MRIHKKTLICHVCYNEDPNRLIIIHKTRRQTHSICLSCFDLYVEPQLQKLYERLRNNIRDCITIQCIGNYHSSLRNCCKKKICVSSIIIPENSHIYTDIFRIKFLLYNPYYSICPSSTCGDISETSELLRVKCFSCGITWCKTCSKSPFHYGFTCTENIIQNNTTPTEKLISKKLLNGEAKLCPCCKTVTERVKDKKGNFVACNKMLCSICGVKWCWLCNDIDIDYKHYNSESKKSCSGKLWQGVKI